MERRLLILMTAPTVVVGLLLFVVCLVSAWSVNHVQFQLSSVLVEHVASMEAAQELEINMRNLRFHCYRYLIEPRRPDANAELLRELKADDRAFRLALEEAEHFAYTPQEVEYVGQIRAAYQRYQEKFQALSHRPPQPSDYEELTALNPVRPVVEPCERYFNFNKEQMNQMRQESERVSRLLRGVLLLLGLAGPVSGLLIGWSMARGLSRSMRSLSVRIQGMAQHLDQEAGVLRVVSEGNAVDLDQQLEQVLKRIEDIVQRLQAQQRELLHAQQLSAAPHRKVRAVRRRHIVSIWVHALSKVVRSLRERESRLAPRADYFPYRVELFRRNRRCAAAFASKDAAPFARTTLRAAGRQRDAANKRPHFDRHQSGSGGARRPRPLSRRSVLSAESGDHRRAAAPRTPR